jgi:hypothetical protein
MPSSTISFLFKVRLLQVIASVWTVRNTILDEQSDSRSRWATCIPLSFGIEMSVAMMSGCSFMAASKRHSPSSTQAITSVSVTVARLTLLANSQLTKDAAEVAYFDVTGHSTPDSIPVGSINRARWQGEVASRKARSRVEERAAAVASCGS